VADPEASARMTVRQAVTHTAGLRPSAADNPSFLFNDDVADDALERQVASLAAMDLLWPPGAGWLYANDGYCIAGRIIEVLSGQGYEEYMRRNVLGPLGLEEAAFWPEERPDLHMATPHDYDRDGRPYPSFRARNRAAAAAGSQLILSARDAGLWLQAMVDRGRVGDNRLISEQSFAELIRPQAEIPPGERGDGDVRYALGWMVKQANDKPVISHGGATITMGSQFIFVPGERLAVAVVANSVSEVTAIVGDGVLALLRGHRPTRSFPHVDSRFQPDTSLWPQLTGAYRALRPQNRVTGPWTIALDEGRLRVRTYPGDSRRRPGDIFLLPLSDLRFVLFGRGRTGGIAEVDMDGSEVHGTWEGVPIVKEHQ
jgi:CubicO group peptidase (beta-lactamase class C family)